MAAVDTALGPVDSSELGRTLMHEHVFHLDPAFSLEFGSLYYDEEKEIARAIDHLRNVRQKGIATIVEVTAPGLGRQGHLLKRVAEGAGVNVIVSSGWFVYDTLPKYFQWRGPDQPFTCEEPFLDFFLRDLTEGVGDNGFKAGILKCATHATLTPASERVLRAVARAHLETGVPITTHQVDESGREQQRVFAEEGVDLERVVIGHCTLEQLDFAREVMDRGSFAGFDRFGIIEWEHAHGKRAGDGKPPFETALDAIATLCAEGYADRIVLSNDDCSFADWCWRDEDRESMGPRRPYSTVPDHVLPGLAERGLGQAVVDRLLIENPRRLFG